MKIIHRYLLRQLLRNFLLALLTFVLLFIVFDFFDRVDKFLSEGASFLDTLKYFVLKIPLTVSLMLPVASLVSTLFTIGILSKNSEITAMRAAGLPISWLARPLLAFGIFISFGALLLNETLVPFATRRVKEVYAIDIKKSDQKGAFNQSDFWWRKKEKFYSADMFDSRTNTILNLSVFEIPPQFVAEKRTDAAEVTWVNPTFRWSMKSVLEYKFTGPVVETKRYNALPLLINEEPQDFYETKTDPHTMSYRQLKRFIKEQRANGIPVRQYYADLYEKLSFPFVNFMVILVVLPFALKPARSGSLAVGFLAGATIAFSYYAIHSISLALGRAELWPPLLAAWVANILLLFIGVVLSMGAESPQ
jgi:lipopolysaccharide export system permease protein